MVLVTWFDATEYPDRSNLRKEGLFWLTFLGSSVPPGREEEVADHVVSSPKAEHNVHLHTVHSPLYSVQDPQLRE